MLWTLNPVAISVPSYDTLVRIIAASSGFRESELGYPLPMNKS